MTRIAIGVCLALISVGGLAVPAQESPSALKAAAGPAANQPALPLSEVVLYSSGSVTFSATDKSTDAHKSISDLRWSTLMIC
jgi:hypothetical protein